MPRVDHELRYQQLKEFVLFDRDKRLLPENSEVWNSACQKLGLTKRNLYLYVDQDRKDVKTRLLEHSNDENDASDTSETGKNNTYSAEKESSIESEIKSNKNSISDSTSNDGESSEEEQEEDGVVRNCNPTKENKGLEDDTIHDIMFKIQQMRLDLEFKKYIRLTSYVDFYIMYWSPEQIKFFLTVLKKLDYVQLILSKSCINKIKAQNYESSNIDLYSIVGVMDQKKIYSFCHMISDSANQLYLFLSEWIKSTGTSAATVPNEIYCPCSYQIISAVCDAFNGSMNYEKYVLKCLHHLQSNVTNGSCYKPLPKCVIRINVVDVMNWIDDLNCFQSENIKKFYTQCILYLSLITDYEEFLGALESIFVLILSETENKDCLNLRNDLMQKLGQQFELKYKTEDHIDLYVIKEMIETTPTSEEVKIFFEDISKKVGNMCTDGKNYNDVPNAYSCKQFSSYLILLCSHFPLWTSVLKCKSSSLLSTYSTTKSVKKLNADIFIQEHISTIDDEIKNGTVEFSKNKCFGNSRIKNDLEHSHLYKTENWMGLGIQAYHCLDNGEDTFVKDLEECDLSSMNLSLPFLAKDSDEKTYDLSNNEISELDSSTFHKDLSIESKNRDVVEKCNESSLINIEFINNDTPAFNSIIDLVKCERISTTICNHVLPIKNEIEDSLALEFENENKQFNCDDKIENLLDSNNHDEQNSNVVIEVNVWELLKHTYLVNANKLGPVHYNGSTINVIHTCPIDSICELLILTLQKENYLHSLFYTALEIDDSVNVLRLLIFYINNKLSVDFIYQERIRIMLEIGEGKNFDTKKNELNCTYSVSSLFSRIMKSTCNSFEKIKCNGCNSNMYTKSVPIIVLGWLRIVAVDGISCLEDELQTCIKDRKVMCQTCHNDAILSYEINSFIVLDVEDSYRDEIIRNFKQTHEYSNIPTRSVRSQLKEIPKYIKINNQDYFLTGFIAFSGSNENNGIAHYFTFYYQGNNTWELRDDMARVVKKEIEENNFPIKVKIALVMYVQQDNID